MEILIQQFLDYIKSNNKYSHNTFVAYQQDMKQFAVFFKNEFVDNNIITDHKLIRNWLIKLNLDKNIPRTINRKISTLKTFYRFLLKREIVKLNPIDKIIKPKTYKKLPSFISEKNMETIENPNFFNNNQNGERDKLIIEIFYGTGIRLTELINIKITDIDFVNNTIKITGKRNKTRTVYCTNELMKQIGDYSDKTKNNSELNNNSYLFVTKKGEKTYPKYIYRIVTKNLSKISTNKKKSPHVLRHTFATHLLNNGADINAIKELLGHANLSATQVYTHNTFEKLNNIYKQAHPRA